MLVIILTGFGLSLVAPRLHRLGRRATGWILALLPLGLVIYFVSLIAPVTGDQVFVASYPWV
ncbi:MAG: hypothetical protein P8186_13810, partial [Anaerolineae bacterium]